MTQAIQISTGLRFYGTIDRSYSEAGRHDTIEEVIVDDVEDAAHHLGESVRTAIELENGDNFLTQAFIAENLDALLEMQRNDSESF